MTTPGVRHQVHVDARPPAGWDPFVRAHAAGTPFHLTDWARCVERGLGHRTLWLWAADGAEVVGVLPLHHVRSRLFGDRLAGSPQAAYGGPLAVDASVAASLVARAEEEAERLGVGHLEVRFAAPEHAVPAEGRWHGTDLYVTIGGPIAADEDGILKAIPKKTRADCRKADERLAATESPEHFGAFHALFAENQRDLGTPVLPRRFLRAVAEAPGLGARVLLLRHGCDDVAACLSLTWDARILPYWAGASAADMDLRPNHGLYVNVLRFARRAGFDWYDFGRSKRGSGSYDFKRRWGFEERPLAYRYRLVRSAEPPNLNPQNERYARKIETWKRLPLPVANLVGPFLSPGLS
jgi:FemAB-related protein (PEP-CTERM system-associated)